MKHFHVLFPLLGAIGCSCLGGCDKKPANQQAASGPAPSQAPTTEAPILMPPAPDAAKQGQPPHAVAISWTDPPGWTRLPRQSPMRAATYKVPQAAGDSDGAELAVFYFGPGQGGEIDGNVERWAQQFGKTLADVKRTNREVNGIKQHVVEIDKGDYSSDMMGRSQEKKKDWAMLAAIAQAPSGSYFFKLTGPQKSVHAQHAAFYTLLDSVKPRE